LSVSTPPADAPTTTSSRDLGLVERTFGTTTAYASAKPAA
jgi:hypothetical protein